MTLFSPRVASAALSTALLLAACATGSSTGVTETLVVVTDEQGAVLPGEVSLFSRQAEDRCETERDDERAG